MILSDYEINQLSKTGGLIEPLQPTLVRKNNGLPVLSYGCSSFGYDIRLSPKDFRIFRHVPGSIVDPKNFDANHLEHAELHKDETGEFFYLPGHSYGLGVAVEKLNLPSNVTAIAIGKSTYARCGIIANVTPAEAGWSGYLTLEFSNASPSDCKIYANEGCVQLLFFVSNHQCQTNYSERTGKYQNQQQVVTLPRV